MRRAKNGAAASGGVLETYPPLLGFLGGAALGVGLWRTVRRRRLAQLSRI